MTRDEQVKRVREILGCSTLVASWIMDILAQPVEVTDEMVEMALRTYERDRIVNELVEDEHRQAMRAALHAALEAGTVS